MDADIDRWIGKVDEMTEREFWTMVRRALLIFVDAIERRWKLGDYSPGNHIKNIGDTDTVLYSEGN